MPPKGRLARSLESGQSSESDPWLRARWHGNRRVGVGVGVGVDVGIGCDGDIGRVGIVGVVLFGGGGGGVVGGGNGAGNGAALAWARQHGVRTGVALAAARRAAGATTRARDIEILEEDIYATYRKSLYIAPRPHRCLRNAIARKPRFLQRGDSATRAYAPRGPVTLTPNAPSSVCSQKSVKLEGEVSVYTV